MATAHTRPAGAYTPTETTNANKYVTDSGSSTAISSSKVDADFNYIIDAMNALSTDIDAVIAAGLPTQTTHADKFLVTDGTTASWAKVGTANIEADAITTAKILDNNVTLDKLSGGTAGALIGYNSSGDPAETAVGTSGQVLTSNGAGAVPTMQTLPASGSMVLISTTTVSGTPASVDITSGIDSTYDAYIITLSGVQPATDNAFLYAKISTDGGSTWKGGASDYQFHVAHGLAGSSAYSAQSLAAHTNMIISQGVGNASNEGFNGVLTLHNPASSSLYTTLQVDGHSLDPSSVIERAIGCNAYNAVTAVDGIQFYFSTGNMVAGTIRLYGIKKA